MRLPSLAAAIALLSFSLAAHADSINTFNFSLGNDHDAFSASGMFTASTVSPGVYLIQSLSGTASITTGPNQTITGLLAPGTFPTAANGDATPANDNLLFVPAAGGGFFDPMGVACILGNGTQVNFHFTSPAQDNVFVLQRDGVRITENAGMIVSPGTQGPPPVTGVTPEPSSIYLLSTGLLGVAGFLRKRVRV